MRNRVFLRSSPMREYEMGTTFDVPLHTFLRTVYGDDGEMFKSFHFECGGDGDVSVSPWRGVSDLLDDETDHTANTIRASRVVRFRKPMDLPSVIARLLSGPSVTSAKVTSTSKTTQGTTGTPSKTTPGTGFAFVETQTLSVDANTGDVAVTSDVIVDSKRNGADKGAVADETTTQGNSVFKTKVRVTYASVVDGHDFTERTLMTAVITVSATGAWALQPVVERMMEHRATAGFREWTQWVDEKVGVTFCDGETFVELPGLKVLGFDTERGAFPDRGGSIPGAADETQINRATTPDLQNVCAASVEKKKKYPATPGFVLNGAPSRFKTLANPTNRDASPDCLPRPPPNDERVPSVSDKETDKTRQPRESYDSHSSGVSENSDGDGDENSDSDDSGSDSDFDDAASRRSNGSFVSAVSARSGWSGGIGIASSDDDAGGSGAARSVPGLDLTTLGSLKTRDEFGEAKDVAQKNNSPPRGTSARHENNLDVSEPPQATTPTPTPRVDDKYRDGWFISSVMRDLSLLKKTAAETRAVVFALEENVRALKSESATTKARLGKNGNRYGMDHRGDGADGGVSLSLLSWITALSLAAGAGYCVATAWERNR